MADESAQMKAAILKQDLPALLKLLQNGADPNGFSEPGKPHLHFAISAGCRSARGIEPVELLIQNGADVLKQDEKGNSVLHVAANVGPMSLYSAYMTRYLIGAGASVQATNNQGKSPLHIAVTTVALGTVKILCQHRAKIDLQDKNGKTPLQYVSETWNGDEEHEYLVKEYTQILKGSSHAAR